MEFILVILSFYCLWSMRTIDRYGILSIEPFLNYFFPFLYCYSLFVSHLYLVESLCNHTIINKISHSEIPSYQSIENRRATAAGAASRSASFSNNGTTLNGFLTWHSRCKSSTASTSEGAVAIEIM